jgi:hypothetical protein
MAKLGGSRDVTAGGRKMPTLVHEPAPLPTIPEGNYFFLAGCIIFLLSIPLIISCNEMMLHY